MKDLDCHKTVCERWTEDERRKMTATSGAGDDEIGEGGGEKSDPYSDLCWKCCKKKGEVAQLYKCGGCKKARYCSVKCRDEDWDEHGTWCERKQKKRRERKDAKRGVN